MIANTRLAAERRSAAGGAPLREQAFAMDPGSGLPTDFPRPPARSFFRMREFTQFDRAAEERLRYFCAAEGVHLEEAILAALAVLVARYTGQNAIVLGTDFGADIGPDGVRIDLTANPNARQLCRAVHRQIFESKNSRDLPASSFQILVLKNDPFQDVPGRQSLAAGRTALDEHSGRCDLVLFLAEQNEVLGLMLDYDGDVFCSETVRRYLETCRHLLGEMIAAPNVAVGLLPLLPPDERERLLVDWNRTDREFSGRSCFHELFEDQVLRTPEAVAVEASDGQLRYGELNRQANRLAHYLRRLGVGPEVRVGICLARTLDMVVAVLGVLKAGGAYVPVALDLPGERMKYQLEKAAVQLVLAKGAFLDPGTLAIRFIRMDDGAALDGERPDNPAPLAGGCNQAYIIYTSGSTGHPKGVVVEHRGLCNVVEATIRYFELGQCDKVLQFAPLIFDGAILEMGLALGSGAALCMPRHDEIVSGAALAEYLQDHRVTLALLPPSVLAAMPDGGFPDLKTVASVSEECSAGVIERWAPGRQFCNGYGPTESTVAATVGVCDDAARPQMIGRPISNKRIYILDSFLSPVPTGVTGELYIGGAGIARGYLNAPDLTADRFVPDPFGAVPGARLYRTGDLARYAGDGAIEFRGRMDRQLSLRGLRMEAGEIEAALRLHPEVTSAVVVARETAGRMQLVAYVALGDAHELNVRVLQSFLRTKLPEYMIPAVYVMLDRLPLAPSGKIDTRKLPMPEESRPEPEDWRAPPTTTWEEVLAAIWISVLGVDRVGRDENFFELGGDSLLVSQVVSKTRSALGVDLQLHHVFEAASLAELALTAESLNGSSAALIDPAQRSVPAPLSSGQRRLWFLDKLEPDGPLYNIHVALRLRGTLAADLLERSFCELVRRHESLRSVFAVVDGEPRQFVKPQGPSELARLDFSQLLPAAREVESQRVVAQEARRHFELGSGLLARATLMRLSEQEHVLVLAMHHIVSDGWSMALLTRELGLVYEAFLEDRPSPLPDLPIQYSDYSNWQALQLARGLLSGHLDFWRQELKDAPQLLELPADHLRPPVETHRGARISTALGPRTAAYLRALGRREGVTPFMTCFAAFVALLHRYTGSEDLLIGSPVSCRNGAEVQNLAGFFLNTLVLRARPNPRQSFRELLAQVRTTCLGAYRHQNLPFETLVEELQPARDLSRHPVVQVFFWFESAWQYRGGFPGLSVERLEVDNGTAKADLSLTVCEQGDGLAASAEFSVDLFEQATMARLLDHYRTVLEGALADPDCQLDRLSLLPQNEIRVLAEWGRAAESTVSQGCVHHLFEAQSRRTPVAIAMESSGRRYRYGELDSDANRLADRLASCGVGPDVPVALLMDRSPEMLAGLLGILKAGGAYVPCDPAWPSERLRWVLQDSGAKRVLTRRRLAPFLPTRTPGIICVDAEGEPSCRPQGRGRRIPVDALAYVMYTSGSTGRPKGVAVTHRSVVSLLRAMGPAIGLTEQDVFLAVTSLTFDIAAAELLLPLCVGARVVICDRQATADGAALASLIESTGTTVLQATPATWRMLVEAGWKGTPHLRMLCGGEVLSRDLAEALMARGEVLFNFYGPTETTIWSTVQRVGSGRGPVPIGRPLANTEIRLLDCGLEPVPIGVPGEIFIGGTGVARGYLKGAASTASQFVPHPLAGMAGERLYRTGDLARYLPDGSLEFLGRLDSQVKVRGYRIELREIEAVLGSHPEVGQSVVTVVEISADDTRVVAYVVPREDKMPTEAELRSHLRQRLPEYMIPAAFVALHRLPTTSNGKIDRRSLPPPDWSRAIVEDARSLTVVEETVAAIWATELGRASVGRHDNFFSLGGHSLMAAKLMTRLRDALRVEVPVRILFEAPTLSRFVHALALIEPSPGHLERIGLLFARIRAMDPVEKRRMLRDSKRRES